MIRMKKISIVARNISLTLIMISGCYGCQKIHNLTSKITKKNANSQKIPSDVNQPSTVGPKSAYVPVRKGRLIASITANGRLESAEKIDVRAEKRIRVGPAKFKVGDPVRRGDILFVTDTKDLEQRRAEARDRVDQLKIEKKAAQSQLALVVKQLDRKTVLVEKGVSAQKELDEARNDHATAEASFRTKELDLRKAEREFTSASNDVDSANIIAPIAGILSAIVPGGEEISEGQPLASISNPAELCIAAEVDEAAVTKLAVGQKIDVKSDAAPDTVINGVVKSINTSPKSAGFSVNTYGVEIAIPQAIVKSVGLRDGYTAEISTVLAEKKSALAIPKSALRRHGEDYYVLVAPSKGSSPSPRQVNIGIETALEVEILKGLHEGEFVVLDVTSERPSQ